MKIRSFLAFKQGTDRMKISWKTQILEIAESDILFVTLVANQDAAIENWLRFFFLEI